MNSKCLSSGLTASPNQRPPPSPAFSSPILITSNTTSIPLNPLGDGSVQPSSQPVSQPGSQPGSQPAPAGKAKAKPNKTMKKAMRIMTANHQLPALPKQSTVSQHYSKFDQGERLSDPDDDDTVTGHHNAIPAAAPRVPTSQRTAHVPLKPQVQIPTQKDDAKTSTITKPSSTNPFKEPKRLGRPPGKRVDPSPPVQAAPGSARERIQAAGLGPQVVEQNLVRHTLGKLNPAQMEAAKRRANIASQPFLPSKDGFRMSAHEVKSKERVKEAAKVEQRPGGDDDEEFFCPSRQTTAPIRAAPTAGGDHKVPTKAKETKCPDLKTTTESSKSNEQEGLKSEAGHEVKIEQGKAASDLQKGGQACKEGERTSSTESLDDDLNLSDSEGEVEESGKVAPKPETKTVDEENIGKEGPVVKTFEEDHYDALDFDLSSDSDGENMEVDRKDDEVVKKEANVVETEKELAADNNVEKEPAVVDINSPASVKSKRTLSENNGQGHPLKSQTESENGRAASKKSKKKKTFASMLESLDYGWRMRNAEDMVNLNKERENLSKERQGFAYEAHTDGLRKHFKNLMGSQNEESFGRLVDSIAATRSLPGCCNMVCDLAYQQLVGEHKDTPLLR